MIYISFWFQPYLLYTFRNVSSSVCSSGERMLSSILSNVSKSFRRMTSFLYRYMIHTCMEMCKTIFKPRHNNLRFLLFLQIFIYALYWFALNENSTQYLYMLKVFDGFNGASFAHFMIVCRIFGKFKQPNTSILSSGSKWKLWWIINKIHFHRFQQSQTYSL